MYIMMALFIYKTIPHIISDYNHYILLCAGCDILKVGGGIEGWGVTPFKLSPPQIYLWG